MFRYVTIDLTIENQGQIKKDGIKLLDLLFYTQLRKTSINLFSSEFEIWNQTTTILENNHICMYVCA